MGTQEAINCLNCGKPLIWGGDNDTDESDHEHSMETNYACNGCGAFMEFWWPYPKENADDEEQT